MDLYLQNGRAIEKQQEARNKAKAWSSDITYERRREREELESYLDILNDNDEICTILAFMPSFLQIRRNSWNMTRPLF